jgi:hypothetical protein
VVENVLKRAFVRKTIEECANSVFRFQGGLPPLARSQAQPRA